MRLLDRYLLRELCTPLCYCLAGFLIFWISFDLISELSQFRDLGLTVAEVVSYYGYRMPEFIVLVMPIALLLALLYSLTHHARHHEITAIRAAGVSLFRLTLPYIAAGTLFSVMLLAVNELWAPQASQRAEDLLRQRRTQEPWHANVPFRNDRDGRTWVIGAFHWETAEMINPQVHWKLSDDSRRTLMATNAIWTNGSWVFHDVQEFVYLPGRGLTNATTRTPELIIPEFTETPEQIRGQVRINRLTGARAAKEVQLSLREIYDYFALDPDAPPRRRALLMTQLHGRLAAPWTCLVVVLTAIPFGAASGRRNALVGVASTLFLCFGYFILLRFGLALGTGGYIPAWVAAWTPNVVFAATGIWGAARVR